MQYGPEFRSRQAEAIQIVKTHTDLPFGFEYSRRFVISLASFFESITGKSATGKEAALKSWNAPDQLTVYDLEERAVGRVYFSATPVEVQILDESFRPTAEKIRDSYRKN